MNEILIAVICYLVIQLFLVAFILISRRRLIPSGKLTILLNNDKEIKITAGGKLLGVLSDNGIFVPSACGGGATCGQCRVTMKKGGGGILPAEKSLISKKEERAGVRLSCQVPVRHDMEIELPPEILETRKWLCRVRSNHNVATFIKELILELPEGDEIDFKPGSYIQIEAPPYTARYADYQIEEEFKEDWIKFNMLQYVSTVKKPEFRAYSMANYPSEKGIIMLNVRIASPPPRAPEGIPPGKVSSYLFNLKPGDEVTVSGPYGTFFIEDSDAEMIYIGGGAGMAPLRSQIFYLFKDLKTKRKVSFWYGGRSMKEVFYQEEFEKLAEEFDNFDFHIALSDPLPEDNWQGYTGFIHQVLFDNYLKDHEAPEDVQYYMCGPPMMAKAVLDMLDNLGVESANIHFDDFGA